MGYKITDIEGVGPAFADKLAIAEIITTEHLLEMCCTKQGRAKISEATGIGEGTLLNWANMADLMRISGIGDQYAELLKETGVDTVKELRTRNADNLAEAMKKINDERNLTKGEASAKTVADWIAKANDLDPKITH